MVMEKDLISIIVPCYNVAVYLSDFLSSVEKINYPNYEVILVDDGSKDETGNILDKYAERHKHAKVIHKENGGVSSARNRGLKEARGKYITFADPDDFVHPDILSELHRTIIETNADVSSCGYKLVGENAHYKIKYKQAKIDNIHFVSGKDKSMSQLLSLVSITVWNRLFKMDILHSISGFPNLFNLDCKRGEDSLFCFLYFSKINSFAYVKTKLYYWRMRNNSATHKEIDSNDTNFFAAGDFLKSLDKSVYKQCQIYMRAYFCLNNMGVIKAIFKSEHYHNPEFAKKVYNEYCNDLPYVKRANLYPLTYRYGTMFTKPVMYLMIRKKLKG